MVIARSVQTVLGTACVLACSPLTVAGEADVMIGHTESNQLAALIEAPQPLPLDPSVFPGFPGWASGEFGFHSVFVDIPAEGVFSLPETCHLQMSLVSIDTGLRVLNDTGSGWWEIGQPFELGVPFFDVHPFITIPQDLEGVSEFSLTVVFHDLTGQFADSDPVSILFTIARPCVADWDHSGAVDSQDFFSFLVSFFASDADVNHDGATTSQDFFDFLGAFFASC